MEKRPDVIKVSDQELKQLKKDIENTNLSASQKKIILTILETYYWLTQMYRAKKLSMNKLRRLFSFKTEKNQGSKDEDKKDDNDRPSTSGSSKKKKTKGHGRNSEKDFDGAKRVFHKLENMNSGEQCPDCMIGKVYPVAAGVNIQFIGQSPIQTTIHKTEKLRCNACGKYFEATLPDEFKEKYDPSADVAIAVQKYALGLPFYRTGKWQNDMGIPVPASTAWERCEVLMNSAYPAYGELIKFAANGELFYGDDTRNKILNLQKELRKNNEKRVGVYTTGIVSKVDDKLINLFFTGRQYCGENMTDLLKLRNVETQSIFMSDALAMNLPKGIKVLWANCMTHARRNFWDYREKYPGLVGYIIKQFAKIYKNDSTAKVLKLDNIERMKFHKKYSEPVLINLRRWALKKLYLKKIEPNEELGDSFKYFFKHYKKLTLFLRVPGAPIDNNIAERLLKTPILNRKNSYFYKSQLGALVGDIIMSLISTCKAMGVNPQKYLLAIHRNKSSVKKMPKNWLPWNFQENYI